MVGFVVFVVLMRGILLISFDDFQKSFLGKLGSPDFGNPLYSEPGKPSAATKELRKKKKKFGYDIFTPDFLHSLYQILCEHDGLKKELIVVRATATELNPKLAALRNEMVAVQAMKKRLEESESNINGLHLAEARHRLNAALLDYESEIQKRQAYFNSMVNPAVRNPNLGGVRFEPVLKPDKYSLPTLKKKAPDQWLYRQLDQILEAEMQPLRISAATRYRVMSALLETVGVDIQPITLKQMFPPQQTTKVKGSQKS